jgi:hypothetical protein
MTAPKFICQKFDFYMTVGSLTASPVLNHLGSGASKKNKIIKAQTGRLDQAPKMSALQLKTARRL